MTGRRAYRKITAVAKAVDIAGIEIACNTIAFVAVITDIATNHRAVIDRSNINRLLHGIADTTITVSGYKFNDPRRG